jgi:hypothetical protein
MNWLVCVLCLFNNRDLIPSGIKHCGTCISKNRKFIEKENKPMAPENFLLRKRGKKDCWDPWHQYKNLKKKLKKIQAKI